MYTPSKACIRMWWARQGLSGWTANYNPTCYFQIRQSVFYRKRWCSCYRKISHSNMSEGTAGTYSIAVTWALPLYLLAPSLHWGELCLSAGCIPLLFSVASGNAGRPQSPEETRNKNISVKKDLEGFLVAQQFKKKSTCNAGDVGDRDLTGSGRSPGEGNGYPLQCSCLENPMDRGAWWATDHRVTKNWTGLKWLRMHARERSRLLLRKLKCQIWPCKLCIC